MGASFRYFLPLKDTIRLIKKYFPRVKLVIYDLGLAGYMIKEVRQQEIRANIENWTC
jgi:hypothetical protein